MRHDILNFYGECKMRWSIKRALILSLAVILVVMLANTLFLSVVVSSLVQPDRRALQLYHVDYLSHPENYGIYIAQHTAHEGKTPYLLVASNHKAPAERGRMLQNQLLTKGVSAKSLQQENGLVVLLHGRQGRKEDLLPVAERLAAAGYISVLPDLPAHGDSQIYEVNYATTPFEQHFANTVLADAKSKLRKSHLTTHFSTHLWGMSLGGAFANAAAAAKPDNWQSMVIVSSYDELEIVVKKRMDFLPVHVQSFYLGAFQDALYAERSLTIADSIPVAWAKIINMPVLVIHGDADDVIDISQGKRLFAAYASPQKQWFTVPRATHSNVLVTDAPVYATMTHWFLTHSNNDTRQ